MGNKILTLTLPPEGQGRTEAARDGASEDPRGRQKAEERPGGGEDEGEGRPGSEACRLHTNQGWWEIQQN